MHKTFNWFFQDKVTDEVTSFSVGEVWLYFYKECLIGVNDMTNNRRYMLKVEAKPTRDGVTSYHEVTEQIVKDAIDDLSADRGVEFLPRDELHEEAFKMALETFSRSIDRELVGSEN